MKLCTRAVQKDLCGIFRNYKERGGSIIYLFYVTLGDLLFYFSLQVKPNNFCGQYASGFRVREDEDVRKTSL